MLFFLLHGEAANLRHLPECLCFLFYGMASILNPSSHPNAKPDPNLTPTDQILVFSDPGPDPDPDH